LFVAGLLIVVSGKNCLSGHWTPAEFSRLQSYGRLSTYWVSVVQWFSWLFRRWHTGRQFTIGDHL